MDGGPRRRRDRVGVTSAHAVPRAVPSGLRHASRSGADQPGGGHDRARGQRPCRALGRHRVRRGDRDQRAGRGGGRALGACYGQGRTSDRPGRLPSLVVADATRAVPGPTLAASVSRTPFAVLCDRHEPRRGTSSCSWPSRAVSRAHLDREPGGCPAVELSGRASLTPLTAARARVWHGGPAFIGALGAGLRGEPSTGVRGAGLEQAEALAAKWNVIVLIPSWLRRQRP